MSPGRMANHTLKPGAATPGRLLLAVEPQETLLLIAGASVTVAEANLGSTDTAIAVGVDLSSGRAPSGSLDLQQPDSLVRGSS